MAETKNHSGFKLVQTSGGLVDVYDPRWPGDHFLFRASSFYKARKWVDAYCAGHQWAVDARRAQAEGQR